ncbi:MAG: alpha-L-fucosidase [Chitinispirillaceae bacterium]|nr:alpha-L-fucosidase [Chitinispirillaceae bacterium]
MVSKMFGGFFRLAGVSAVVAVFVLLSISTISAQNVLDKRLDSLQRVHVAMQFGMFIHFNMNTFYPGWGESRTTPTTFAPTNVDCGQWARAAVSAKMKYAILTCKHHDGFALWPSQQNAPNGLPHYTVMESSYKHDIVKMFVDSMRAYNIVPCLYFSGWDAASGIPGPYSDPATVRTQWANDSAFVLGQIRELLNPAVYGQIPLFVFDGFSWDMGQWAFPIDIVRTTIKKLQPNCLVVDHNGGAPWQVDIVYYEEPIGVTAPTGNKIASCQGQTISSDWFWNSSAADINQLMTVSNITQHLARLDTMYCNFVLNCPPNKTGVFDAAIVTRLAQVGTAWNPAAARTMPLQPAAIDRPYVPVTATATSNASTAVNAIDNVNDFSGGHQQTLWTSSGTLPQSVTLDLGVVKDSIDMLMYQPRRFGSTTGNITSYRIYTGTTSTALTQITTGTSSSGTWGIWPSDSTIKWAQFARQSARYVRLEAVTANSSSSDTINDNDPNIIYYGWYYSSGRGLGDYDNDAHFSTTIGDSCTYTFNGAGIDYLSEKYSDMGNVDVYIDGVFKQNVNLYVTGTRQVRQAVYSITGLASGSHTIKIVNKSTAYGCVDAFRLYGAASSSYAVINNIAVGAHLPYSQVVGVKQTSLPTAFSHSIKDVYKTSRMVTFDARFSQKVKSVAVYDLGGKLLTRKSFTKNIIDLQKDCGVPEGVYVVKTGIVK